MKKTITNILLAGSLVIILDSFRFWTSILEFLFVGIVPGMNSRINPSIMLMLFSVSAGLLIGIVFVLPALKKYEISKTKQTALKTSRKLA